MWFVGLLLLAAAGGLAYGHRSRRRRLGLIESTEVCTVEHLRKLAASMAEGFGSGALRFFAAVNGTVRCAEPLVSELAEAESVYYSMRVHRDVEEDRPAGERGKGKGLRRTSQQLAHNQRSLPFTVEDATGAIAVDPSGARFIAEQALSRFEPGSGGEALSVGTFTLDPTGHADRGARTLGYRFEEEAIPVGREVYVLGEVRDPGGELRIGSPEGKGDFVISVKSKAQLVRELGSGSKAMLIGAAVCGVLGLVLVLFG